MDRPVSLPPPDLTPTRMSRWKYAVQFVMLANRPIAPTAWRMLISPPIALPEHTKYGVAVIGKPFEPTSRHCSRRNKWCGVSAQAQQNARQRMYESGAASRFRSHCGRSHAFVRWSIIDSRFGPLWPNRPPMKLVPLTHCIQTTVLCRGANPERRTLNRVPYNKGVIACFYMPRLFRNYGSFAHPPIRRNRPNRQDVVVSHAVADRCQKQELDWAMIP